jgi:hypothetical protein
MKKISTIDREKSPGQKQKIEDKKDVLTIKKVNSIRINDNEYYFNHLEDLAKLEFARTIFYLSKTNKN